MYLKRLELLGFKSFPDKTIIKLTPGVTSIIGPNGCGKTNILDSIRWVLGEQKVSQLRGTKMEEVIFSGTRDVKSLGMAEVTLVVQNNKGLLPTEYSEVQITRRLFRSGESEYLINKVPCRLKDITELFMDTGMGAHVYSVIQQHMIESILSDRADDRRFLFEEASGISKYKNRKKAATRKLEATDNDLLRLKDIVAEINTQVNSLKRQMTKARRYKEMSEELKGWELFLGKSTIEQASQERRELLKERDGLIDKHVNGDTEIDSLSAEQEERRKKMIDIDHTLTKLGNLIFEQTELAHKYETEISVLRERRDNNAQLQTKNSGDIEALKSRKRLLGEQIIQIASETETTTFDLKKVVEELEKSQSELSTTDDEVMEARRKYDDLNRKLMELEGLLSAGRSDDSNLKEQDTEINSLLANIDQQLERYGGNKSELLEKRLSLENDLSVLQSKYKNSREKKIELEEQISTISENLEEISGRVFDLAASLEAAEARRNLLEEMILHYEGFGAGVVAVMEDNDRWPGLYGTVADSIIPQKGYDEAIEAALGDIAGYMICYNRDSAESIISHLKAEKKGRAGFLIIDQSETHQALTRPEINADGFIGWANTLVNCDDKLNNLTDLVLARTAVVEPEAASSVLSLLPAHFSLVTTDGKYFENSSILSGGSREGISLLGRKEKVNEQIARIESLKSELGQYKDERNESTRMLGSRQAELNNTITEIESGREEIDTTERKITSFGYEIQTIDTDVERLTKEQSGLRAKHEALRTRQYTLNLNHDQLSGQKDKLLGSLSDQETNSQEIEKEADIAESRHSGLQIKQVELRSQMQQLESRQNHTDELIGEIDNNINTKADEIKRAGSETESDKEKVDEHEKSLKIIFEKRSGYSDEQIKVREEHSSLRESLDNREERLRTLRKQRDEATAKLHSVEIRITEIESKIEGNAQRLKDEYDLDIEEITVENPNSSIPSEERSARMLELKERLRDFGGVNLLALEEYDTAKERQDFLTTQMEDLLNAKSTLQTTINKINQTAKKLFIDTLEKVRENFRQVFKELFTGGEANLKLTNPDDPLESPIEIIARPRGKKLLSIAQMSGGERALTAISLLFAIYLVKPSPFCILDEIDAPLDDANIHRFLKIIRTFSEQTQFIVITHNKITMEAADNLYGITMEQPGISRVVSVRFNEDDEEGPINTDMSTNDDDVDSLPEAIRERMTPSIKIPTENAQED